MNSLLRYSISLPVTTAVVGMPQPEMLAHNVETARNFLPLNDQEKERLRQQLKSSREELEKRLVGHLDGPTANPRMFLA
jgi:predicted aldo/keto reductase-like oxidoreductase